MYAYYAEDPATGRVEYEYDHVLLGDVPVGHPLLPDPDEVADVRWIGRSRSCAGPSRPIRGRTRLGLPVSPNASPSMCASDDAAERTGGR